MIVYLARDIPAFVMYCVNGESGLSLLIESTDSMIYIYMYIYIYIYIGRILHSSTVSVGLAQAHPNNNSTRY